MPSETGEQVPREVNKRFSEPPILQYDWFIQTTMVQTSIIRQNLYNAVHAKVAALQVTCLR